MNQSQITMPALLSMPFRPLKLWMIERQIRQSERNVEVIQMQTKQLRLEERYEHERQVQLVAERNAIARG